MSSSQAESDLHYYLRFAGFLAFVIDMFFFVFFLFFRSVRDDFGSVIGKCQGKTSFISHTLCV